MKVISAELELTSFHLEHNILIAAADHAGPEFRTMLEDSNVARYYRCARAITTAIIARLLTLSFPNLLYIQSVQLGPFTQSLHSSNGKACSSYSESV